MLFRRQLPLLLVAMATLVVAACASGAATVPVPTQRPAVPTYTPMPTFTAEPARSLPTAAASQTVAAMAPTATAALTVKDWDRATIAETGIALDIPKTWKRLGTAWEWSVYIDGGPHIGVSWADAGQGREPTAMLPAGAVSLDATPIELPWGKGMVYTVQVVAGKVTAIEAHAIIRLGSKRDYDFYASAPTQEDLTALRPILQHMLESVALLGG